MIFENTQCTNSIPQIFGIKPGWADTKWSIETQSPDFLINDGLRVSLTCDFDLQYLLLCIANKQDGQKYFQYLKTEIFFSNIPEVTNLFIIGKGKWSQNSCHKTQSFWRGVKGSGLIWELSCS